MTDQKRAVPAADRADRSARPTELRQTIAAVIAVTRREWISQMPAMPAPEETALKRARFAHPLVRYIFDSKRNSSWRARVGRQGRKQSAERFADPDCAPGRRRLEPV
ncbi:MAG: hypothetical protein IH605_07640 [Burkholderiales bacterium]|nr:hypothetical protein [Burkholderiales bacterium]